MTPDELYTQAKESPVLSKEVTDTLLESLEYSSISFLNQAVEILGIFRARLERGDRITGGFRRCFKSQKFPKICRKYIFRLYLRPCIYRGQ